MATIREQFQKALHKHDGEDHINVSPFGETSSGKIAYLESKKKFYIPHMGDFLSPRNFANWAVSGGDEHQRFNANAYDMRVGDVREFRVLMLYAKYYQMASLRKSLVKDKASLDKPWTMYKKFVSGIKEYHRWEEYPGIVKEMVRHLVYDFGKKPMNFDEIIPGLTEIVNRHIRVIAGDEFVGIENIDKLVSFKRRTTPSKAVRTGSGTLLTSLTLRIHKRCFKLASAPTQQDSILHFIRQRLPGRKGR